MLVHGLIAAVLATGIVPAAPAQVDCARVKCLALTFDDGPGLYTGKLLSLFAKEKVKGTFFLVGKQVERRPELARQIFKEGHEVGNHSFDHPSLPELDDIEVISELRSTQDAIKQATGRLPTMMRPPYGHTNEHVLGLAAQEGLSQVMWTGTTLDWQLRDQAKIHRAVLKLAKRNGVILMHDVVPDTVAAMPAIIKDLKKRGYHLVTVSALLQGRRLEPGESYPPKR